MRWTLLAVAVCCVAVAAAGACDPTADVVPWPALYGDAGFTAFQASAAQAVGACNFTATFATAGWAPTWQGGGNPALDDDGRMFVGMQRPGASAGAPVQAGVAAFNATTGKRLFLTPLPMHDSNTVVLVGADRQLVVVGAQQATGSPQGVRTTQVTVLDTATGKQLYSTAVPQVSTVAGGTPAALALTQSALYLISQPSSTAYVANLTREGITLLYAVDLGAVVPACARPDFAVPAWSFASFAPSYGVFEISATKCTPTRLAIVHLDKGEVAYVTPPDVSVVTYSFSPSSGHMIMNWGTQIVSLEVTTGTIAFAWNVSHGWVAHDTMVDPCSGQVYIPMNWTAPAGVVALDATLQPLWTYTLPRGLKPQDSFVQTIQAPWAGPAAGAVTTLATQADANGTVTQAQLIVLSPAGDTIASRSLPFPPASLLGAISAGNNMYRVLKTSDSTAAVTCTTGA